MRRRMMTVSQRVPAWTRPWRTAACASAAATRWSSPATSGRRCTWWPRTTCAPAPAPSRRRWRPPTTGRAASSSPPRPSRAPPRCGIFAEEGLRVDCASGGELHLALKAGFDPERDRPARQREVRGRAADGRRGRRRAHRARRRRPRAARAHRPARAPPALLVRVTPGVEADTHERIMTGPRGLEVRLPPPSAAAIERPSRSPSGWRSSACTSTSARSSSTLRRSTPRSGRSRASATSPSTTSAAAWPSATRATTTRRSRRSGWPTSPTSRTTCSAPARSC